MHSRMIRCVTLSTVVLLVASGVWAQPTARREPDAKTLTITIMGTLGPVLSGSDPIGANGKHGTLAVKASESLSPTKHTSNSATYTLPAGAMTITVGSYKFTTKSPSTMMVKLTNSADILTLVAKGSIDGVDFQVTGTAYLQSNSWTNKVLKHPTTFSPSPQTLTAAKKANGPGSKVEYTAQGFGSTILGLSGSASNSDSADDLLYGEDW